MIYGVNSPPFGSFLSQKGGAYENRKIEEQKPEEQRLKANKNKPIMTE
ncbi:wound-induced basic protein-like isoform X3 [Cucurbita moschata]|uniref:Wound-induced basic protein-like isoform X3 n=1 Tax=Cucurbita moschata TaxID=3662 RepID=A0A6J1EWU3_CUCMO|nr:wound-induced basic protein-like isoform X3 [Cucurbita moschata]